MNLTKKINETQPLYYGLCSTPITWLSKQKVGKKAIFDYDLKLWFFESEEEAERIARDNTKGDITFHVRLLPSKIVDILLHGTQRQKKALKLRCKYEIEKSELDTRESALLLDCHKYKMDKSFIVDDAPQNLSHQELKIFHYLKNQNQEIEKRRENLKNLLLKCNESEAEAKINLERIDPSEWPFKVLGYNNKREILLWHQGDLMLIPVKQLSKKDLQLLMGTLEIEEETIINEAHRKGKVYDDKPIKAEFGK
jgi:hypothetical protein